MSDKICFLAPSAYPLLGGRNATGIIGPAIHQVSLATELLKRNFTVIFITYDEGGSPVEQINGMKVIKIYPADSHLNLALKAFRLWRAMSRAAADIYFQQGEVPGIAALFCKLRRKRFVLGIGSDAHISTKYNFGLVDRLGSRLDIRFADVVIV